MIVGSYYNIESHIIRNAIPMIIIIRLFATCAHLVFTKADLGGGMPPLHSKWSGRMGKREKRGKEEREREREKL